MNEIKETNIFKKIYKSKKTIAAAKRIIIAILLCVMTFSIAKTITYYEQQAESNQMQSDIIHDHVTPDDSQSEAPVVPEEDISDTPDTDEDAPVDEYTPDPETINVDFDTLTAKYPDVVGYIYGANTKIQYPIAYTSSSNDYYLNRDLDGNLNANGSIFIEHLNAPDFSDQNTILYGHHMRSGLMFAGLVKYKDASYYSAHPYFYIYTPAQNYRLDLFAGFVCAHDDEVFALSLSQDQLANMAAKSTFKSNIDIPTGNLVTLCTCSYEFNNARYVVVGELVPLDS